MNQRLYRSRDERIIAGVAGGLAEQFNVDPSLVRILWVALAVLTAGVAVLFYLVMAFIVPEEPAGDQRWSGWQRRADAYLWPEPGTPAAAGPAEGAAGPSEAVSAGRPAEAASGAAGVPLAGPAASAATAPGPSAPIGTESIWAGAPPTGAAAAGGSRCTPRSPHGPSRGAGERLRSRHLRADPHPRGRLFPGQGLRSVRRRRQGLAHPPGGHRPPAARRIAAPLVRPSGLRAARCRRRPNGPAAGPWAHGHCRSAQRG